MKNVTTAREYILDAVGQRTNEVPTANCGVVVWAVVAAIDAASEVIGPLYDFDAPLAQPE